MTWQNTRQSKIPLRRVFCLYSDLFQINDSSNIRDVKDVIVIKVDFFVLMR